jgi:hypothetical protein
MNEGLPPPQNPEDVERLWATASPLDPARLPEWLSAETAADYRLVKSFHRDGAEAFLAEMRALQEAGLFFDENSADPELHHLYLQRPGWNEVWSIGIYGGTSPLEFFPLPGLGNPVLTRADVTDVPAIFVADPFLIRVAATWHLFFEVMNWRSGKGEIGLATSTDGRAWTYRQIVLAEPFHLSYPYVFAFEGEYYLVPESFQAGGVRLYRATSFPTQWTLAGVLLTGPYLADSSLVQFDNRWWLFVEAAGGNRHDLLRLFFSDKLQGPWREHPASPIRQNDPYNARPAGRVHVADGRVVRYAQGCQPAYGTDVRAFEITELTSTRYHERPVGKVPLLGPGNDGWNAGGMHHVDPHQLANDKWLVCVDGWRPVRW